MGGRRYLLIADDGTLVRTGPDGATLALGSEPPHPEADQAVVHADAHSTVVAVAVDSLPEGDSAHPASYRHVAHELPPAEAAMLTRAVVLLRWHRSSRFCPSCGHPTTPAADGCKRRCDAEQIDLFPRIDPAVIVAVRDTDDRLLLVRHVGTLRDRYTIPAGFVEAGETLEEAVAREVLEETGLAVRDIGYVASQSWPYPGSLMLAFEGRAWDRRLRLEPGELEAARWVDRPQLRTALASGELRLASRGSIAYRMIERWYGARLPAPPG